jgi:threonine synthase
VPTGNFGNVFAGYVAQKMGLPVHKFIVGSNKNDILTRFFNTKSMEKMGVVPTISPSMDIQISSNFERLLFELSDRNGAAVRQYMDQFKTDGRYTVSGKNWDQAFHLFAGFAYDDDATKAIITDFYTRTGELLDPHSAIGIEAARAAHIPADVPVVALATAHPAKFPAAVESATGQHPALPTFLADLFHREERITNQPNDLAVVQSFIREKVS